jgi:polyphosphate kinase 2 (PPK2 family)
MAKSKKILLPRAGADYEILPNGVIRVARCNKAPSQLCGEGEAFPEYLRIVDHTLSLEKKDYREQLELEEKRFNKLVRKLRDKKKSLILVLQGRDGAGKSGAAKHILEACDFDAKLLQWIPIGAPNQDELQHGYLWRFFSLDRMPRFGQARIFDRSWYERVLAEPVKGIINEKVQLDSYAELRSFDWLLSRQGAVVVKVWMDISYDEQGKRFEDRKENKPWKFSEDDTEARKHWDEYTDAANQMIHLTGTSVAPWHIIASEDKRFSRVTVLKTLNDAMSAALSEKN